MAIQSALSTSSVLTLVASAVVMISCREWFGQLKHLPTVLLRHPRYLFVLFFSNLYHDNL